MATEKNDLWTLTTPSEQIVLKILDVSDISLEPTLTPPDFPVAWMRDPQWRDRYLGDLGRGVTIGNAGCALCCFVAWLQWKTGKPQSVLDVQTVLHDRNLLGGADHTLMRWASLQEVWLSATYDRSCFRHWRNRPADLSRLAVWLERGPVIVEVDFKFVTAPIDQHFVVAIDWIEGALPMFKSRLWVMDPWEGAVIALPPAYYNDKWDGTQVVRDYGKAARVITGARAIGHAGEIP